MNPPATGAGALPPARFFRDNLIVPLDPGPESRVFAAVEKIPAHVLDNLALFLRRPVKIDFLPESKVRELLDGYLFRAAGIPLEAAPDSPAEEKGTNTRVDLSEQAPVVQAVNTILYEAVQRGASDIHLHPEPDGLTVRYRVDGVLHDVRRLPASLHEGIVCRVKVMSRLDIAQTRLPQDGGMRLQLLGRDIDLRVSIIPSSAGEDVSLRILDRRACLLDIDRLGLDPSDHRTVMELLSGSRGMIVVTGPTGSGKTTSLYAFIRHLVGMKKNIVTIEDPVEYQIPNITQIEVKPDIGLTFAAGLRSVLRHDPDVMLVGEIRDPETARTAVQSALTGHLVLTTLHTPDTISAAARLFDLGIEPYLAASALRGIVAQRLVRTLCPACRGVETARKDCAECFGSGFRGRTGVFEIVCVDEALRDVIGAGATQEKLREYYRHKGIPTLRDKALEKARSGLTSQAEALAGVA